MPHATARDVAHATAPHGSAATAASASARAATAATVAGAPDASKTVNSSSTCEKPRHTRSSVTSTMSTRQQPHQQKQEQQQQRDAEGQLEERLVGGRQECQDQGHKEEQQSKGPVFLSVEALDAHLQEQYNGRLEVCVVLEVMQVTWQVSSLQLLALIWPTQVVH